MEISVARKRLEEMRADLDRTVSILMGEHHLVRGGGAEPGDAGANLTEADRNAAAMETAVAQRAEVIAALARIDDGSYGRCVDCAGPVPSRGSRPAPRPPAASPARPNGTAAAVMGAEAPGLHSSSDQLSPTESSERAWSSALTSSPKLDGSLASR